MSFNYLLSFSNKQIVLSNKFKIKKTLERLDNFDKYFNKHLEVTSVKSRSLIKLPERKKIAPQ